MGSTEKIRSNKRKIGTEEWINKESICKCIVESLRIWSCFSIENAYAPLSLSGHSRERWWKWKSQLSLSIFDLKRKVNFFGSFIFYMYDFSFEGWGTHQQKDLQRHIGKITVNENHVGLENSEIFSFRSSDRHTSKQTYCYSLWRQWYSHDLYNENQV